MAKSAKRRQAARACYMLRPMQPGIGHLYLRVPKPGFGCALGVPVRKRLIARCAGGTVLAAGRGDAVLCLVDSKIAHPIFSTIKMFEGASMNRF